MNIHRLLAGLFIALCLSDVGFAMRCKQSLVFEGDSKYIVERKCGPPLAKDIYQDSSLLVNNFDIPYGIASDVYEVWTYQQSPNEFLYEVLFQNGRVIAISANRSF
ncbi:hypothetical protein B1207_11910 [Legionella quinlivanii]|uniref:DUF2845 domain-containing protein n=1 Tax=Legionella quinlivanii TaxID=45073 RepID=A0A364LHM1_9GAMM|nr:DUF2845 domain-containing protein [Legionella quinlivanii]RAP35778.1 hypothetical protein B1207_11910 [Legionella quinlivanii]